MDIAELGPVVTVVAGIAGAIGSAIGYAIKKRADNLPKETAVADKREDTQRLRAIDAGAVQRTEVNTLHELVQALAREVRECGEDRRTYAQHLREAERREREQLARIAHLEATVAEKQSDFDALLERATGLETETTAMRAEMAEMKLGLRSMSPQPFPKIGPKKED